MKAVLELLIKAIERTVVGNYHEMGIASADEVFRLLEEAEKELAKQQTNNPLTLDEVMSLKNGDSVWLKDDEGLRAIEYSHTHNSKYGESIYYFMFDLEGIEGYDLDYLNKTFFLYRNKPDIADVIRNE